MHYVPNGALEATGWNWPFLFCFFLPNILYNYHNVKKGPKLGSGSISKS